MERVETQVSKESCLPTWTLATTGSGGVGFPGGGMLTGGGTFPTGLVFSMRFLPVIAVFLASRKHLSSSSQPFSQPGFLQAGANIHLSSLGSRWPHSTVSSDSGSPKDFLSKILTSTSWPCALSDCLTEAANLWHVLHPSMNKVLVPCSLTVGPIVLASW